MRKFCKIVSTAKSVIVDLECGFDKVISTSVIDDNIETK